jgi:hypothetical protein
LREAAALPTKKYEHILKQSVGSEKRRWFSHWAMRWAELASLLEGFIEVVVMVFHTSLMSLGTVRGSQLDDLT